MEADRLADSIQTSADELVGELKAVRDSVNSVFSRMRAELGGNKWRKHLGIRL